MQESRLFKIVYYLLDNEKVTAAELAEKFEVSVRTIYRDIDALSGAGIPIYSTQGKGGGVTLLEGFSLEKSLLSTEEQTQIITGLQALNSIEQHNEEYLLTKLGSYFKANASNWIEVDLSNWRKSRHIQRNFNLIKSAIFDRNIIQFKYFGLSEKESSRSVEPLKLVFKEQDWYLYSFCRLRNDYRLFKLSRIKNLEITKEKFSCVIPKKELKKEFAREEKCIPVVLNFDNSISYRVFDEFDEKCITQHDDYLCVKIELPDNKNILLNYFFSFGCHIEVIEPTEIRELMICEIEKMNKIYKS